MSKAIDTEIHEALRLLGSEEKNLCLASLNPFPEIIDA